MILAPHSLPPKEGVMGRCCREENPCGT